MYIIFLNYYIFVTLFNYTAHFVNSPLNSYLLYTLDIGLKYILLLLKADLSKINILWVDVTVSLNIYSIVYSPFFDRVLLSLHNIMSPCHRCNLCRFLVLSYILPLSLTMSFLVF